ncbi:hypothetical protein [Nocardioides sp.]|uniref:hypothetical protein n=1 Tax=Nocardioides sp. TaxID=35761 RepID=UPI0037852DA8
MTITSTSTSAALQGLAHALDAPRGAGVPLGSWRWTVRKRMTAVRDQLVAETLPVGAFPAREVGLARERDALLARLSALGAKVLVDPDVDRVRDQLHRLVVDVAHHVQRRHDLAYDEVELELGGSE